MFSGSDQVPLMVMMVDFRHAFEQILVFSSNLQPFLYTKGCGRGELKKRCVLSTTSGMLAADPERHSANKVSAPHITRCFSVPYQTCC